MPVGHVTNGVHMPSWDSAEADDLWTEACGKERWLGTDGTPGAAHPRVSPTPSSGNSAPPPARRSSITCASGWSRQLAACGRIARGRSTRRSSCFDPDALTLGFARRFATYKRPNLLLHDPERLLRLLTNPERPVQLIVAGKAHPDDKAGQAMIQEWTAVHPAARGRAPTWSS